MLPGSEVLSKILGGSTTGKNAFRGAVLQGKMQSQHQKENNPVTGHEFITLFKFGKSYKYIEAQASMNFH